MQDLGWTHVALGDLPAAQQHLFAAADCSPDVYATDDGQPRLADSFGIDDGLFVDGVRRCGLGRVGFDAITAAAPDELDELD